MQGFRETGLGGPVALGMTTLAIWSPVCRTRASGSLAHEGRSGPPFHIAMKLRILRQIYAQLLLEMEAVARREADRHACRSCAATAHLQPGRLIARVVPAADVATNTSSR